MRLAFSGLLLILLASPLQADEGMWTFDNFPARSVQQEYGVRIDQAWLDQVRLATVRLENGCTGSFASDNGLILTNRHCTFSCLSEHTDADHNVWRDGLVARHPGEEKRCSSQQVSVLMTTTDITKQVADAIAELDPPEIEETATVTISESENVETGEAVVEQDEAESVQTVQEASDAAINEARNKILTRLEQACEAEAKGKISCEAVALYHGGQYFLYQYKRYSDVRLVFAPEVGIGAFGGDPDNFNFPRWCLDAAFLRVYDDDGQPAKTPDYLRWRAAGAQAGEPVFVPGHPGSTERQLTTAQLELLRNVSLPDWLMRNAELRGRYKQFSTVDEQAFDEVQEPLTRIENGLKVRKNELAALLDDRLMDQKRQREATLRAAVTADPVLAAEVGDPWSQIDQAIVEYLPFRKQYLYIGAGVGFGGKMFAYARTLVRGAAERAKPNEERLREYRGTALPRIEQSLFASAPVHPRLEQIQLAFSLGKMREELGPDDPNVQKILGNHTPEQLARSLVEGSGLADPALRRKLWEGGTVAVAKSDDPMIRLARAMDPEARALRKRYEEVYEGPIKAAAENLARARFAIDGTSTYPDATFTLRLSYGAVKGWNELGHEVDPFTYLGRLYARNTGQPPFDVPKSWMQRKRDLDMKTRFNFVATIDATGGNSGSPVINKDAQLVGLLFDGNAYSIAGAYWYDPALNRAISVHPAIILEALEKVYDADYVLGELSEAAGR